MRDVLRHLRTHIGRGVLASIPFALSYLAIHLIYVSIDQRVLGILGLEFPGLGLLLLLVTFYLLGLIASNVIGRRALSYVEKLSSRIPIIKTTYNVGRQLTETFSGANQKTFRRAVLVEFLRPGMWTVGFVVGTIIDRKNDDAVMLKVYVPTPPNPASGTMVIVSEAETRDPGWTIEEALKLIMSGGIISPPHI